MARREPRAFHIGCLARGVPLVSSLRSWVSSVTAAGTSHTTRLHQKAHRHPSRCIPSSAQVPWARLRLGSLLQAWPKHGAAAAPPPPPVPEAPPPAPTHAATSAAASAQATAASPAAPEPGCRALPSSSSAPGRVHEQRQELHQQADVGDASSFLTAGDAAASGASFEPIEGVPLSRLPLYAYPGAAPDRALRRVFVERLLGEAERARRLDEGAPLAVELSLRILMEVDIRDPVRSSIRSSIEAAR